MSREVALDMVDELSLISHEISDVVWRIERGKICLRKAAEQLDESARLLKEWQDINRTYTPGEHQLAVRIDGSIERRKAA